MNLYTGQKSVFQEKNSKKENYIFHHMRILLFFISLFRVVDHESQNKMTAHNVSTVFAPTLMPAPDLSKYGGLPGMTYEISALEIIISNQQNIFN